MTSGMEKVNKNERRPGRGVALGPVGCICQGTIGCTPNSVPMVFIVFSRDSWGLYIITHEYPLYRA